MSDSSAFVNSYIENAIGMLHENISTILQLKTQTKLSNDIAKAKVEEVIKLQEELNKVKSELEMSKSDLQSKLDFTRSDLEGKLSNTRTELQKTKTIDNEQINNARKDAKRWEDECNALKNKVSVLDTLTNQFNDVKKQLIDKNNEFNSLKEKYDSLQNLSTELDELKKLLDEKEKQIEILENQNVKKSSQSFPKKSINTKNIVSSVEPEEKADDF